MLLDAGCLCHGEPVHAEVCNVQVQTDVVEMMSVAVQVEVEDLNLQVDDSDEVEVDNAQVGNVLVSKPSQSKMRRERRKKTKEMKEALKTKAAEEPLLPFPPRH